MKTFTHSFIRPLILVLLLGLGSILQAQTADYEWSISTGGTKYEQAEEVAIDASGNVITVGYFQDVVDFDPDPANQLILSVGNTTGTNAFVQKQDEDGDLLWAFSLGDANSFVQCFGVTTDAAGNIHVCGRFLNTVDFDPDPNVTVSATSSNWDAFVIKVDPNGNLIWARTWGGSLQGFTRNITLDDNGNVYTCGWFRSTTDFDPGAGTFIATATGNASGYIHKMDSAGNFQWVYTMLPNGSFSPPPTIDQFAIKWDPNGYIITTGYFNGQIDFDGGSGTDLLTPPSNSSDIFVEKITTNGDHVWAKQMGGSDSDFGFDMAVDTTGNIYVTGNFRDTADFDPDPVGVSNLNAIQSSDVFLVKLDSTGAFGWATAIGSLQGSSANCMDIDNQGNLYIASYFQDSAFFSGQDTLVPSFTNSIDMYMAKYDNSGNYLWAHAFSGFGDEWPNGLALGSDNGVHVVGNYSQVINLDPFNQTATDTSAGQHDFFVLKLGQCIMTASTQTESACGSFQWIDGNTYMASTDSATWIVLNAAGCDSVITLNLTINNATSATDVHTACNSFTWIDNNTYSSNNTTATFTLPNSAGCDSVVTLDLTINAVETAVILDSFTLTAAADSAQYVWIDCDNNTLIDSATGQFYTATQNGNYAVVVTQNGCTDTSNCVSVFGVGMGAIRSELSFKVYPNPAHSAFNVELPNHVTTASVKLFDIRGVEVWQQTLTTSTTLIQPRELPTGIYTVQVATDATVSSQRLLLVD